MNNTVKIYLAAGWFNPTQAEELTRLEAICDTREWIDLASPRRIFVCNSLKKKCKKKRTKKS